MLREDRLDAIRINYGDIEPIRVLVKEIDRNRSLWKNLLDSAQDKEAELNAAGAVLFCKEALGIKEEKIET